MAGFGKLNKHLIRWSLMALNVEEGIGSLLATLGGVALWLQALGIILVLWIIFNIVMVLINFRRMKEVYKIKDDMKRIEGKIDRLLKKK